MEARGKIGERESSVRLAGGVTSRVHFKLLWSLFKLPKKGFYWLVTNTSKSSRPGDRILSSLNVSFNLSVKICFFVGNQTVCLLFSGD